MPLKIAFACLLAILFTMSPAVVEGFTNHMVVFAHMVNTIPAVDWAMNLGANGVEMDLRFTPSTNMPLKFRHSYAGTPCDCSAGTLPGNSVCAQLSSPDGNLCHAETDAATMLQHLATKTTLAAVYIDSKVDGDDAPQDLNRAGQNVVAFMDTNLFAKGYEGQVVISAPSTQQFVYLQGAVTAANGSVNKASYYFAIDGEGSDLKYPATTTTQREGFFKAAMDKLMTLQTRNRLYLTGISALIPAATFYDQIALAMQNRRSGVVSGVGIWSIDNPASTLNYLAYGLDAIVSNSPGYAIQQILIRGAALARPGLAFQPAQSDGYTAKISIGEMCESNDNCANAMCGRGTAADGAVKVCCPGGRIDSFGGYDYCTGMPDTSVCWSDDMCATGYCRGNEGGLQKGICGKLAVNASCGKNADCSNGACGRPTAADNAPLVCCASGNFVTYGGYDYCDRMPKGATCWLDKMCQSESCKGNGYGVRKGSCE